MKFRKRILSFTAFVLFFASVALMVPLTASAASYTSYTQVSLLPNTPLTGAQGFAVVNGYAYSVKVNTGLDTQAVIYATNMSDGTTTLMTNGDDNTTIATYLGHANDMADITIDGVTYLYVVTMKNASGTKQLIKLKVVGNTYFKVGEFNIQRSSALVGVTALAITNQTATTIDFLFKDANDFYSATLGVTATSGTITLSTTPDFLINLGSYSGYTPQGLGYWKATDTIYVPHTSGNNSVALVYHNVSTASGTINMDSNLTFSITESAYIEFESVDIAADGKLWFNTNRNGGYDNVGYFNGYVASGINTMFAGKSAASTGTGFDYELGTIFQPGTSGYIAGVKVFGVSGESGIHKVRIWRNSDGALIAGPFNFTFTGSNSWVTFYLPSVLNVTANTSYTVSVSTGTDANKRFGYISGDLASAGSSGNLSWAANAGVNTTTVGTRPTSTWNSTNYLRDVIFYPASNNTENMFDAKAATNTGSGTAYELGTIFQSSSAGQITGVRVFGAEGESGDHTIRIWRNSTNTVVAGPYTFKFTGNDNWVTFNLPTPLAITAGTEYTVSVSTGTDSNKRYGYISGNLTSAGNNANHLSWPANAGVFSTTLGSRPTTTWNSTNYLRDILFDPS